MQMMLLIGIVIIGTVLIQLTALAIHYWRSGGRYRGQIVATIEQVSIWVNGWYVKAVWTDALTGKSYVFYSHLIESGLEPVVGENVIVRVDPKNFHRYRIML